MKEDYKKTEEIIMHTSFIPLKTNSGESAEKNKAFSNTRPLGDEIDLHAPHEEYYIPSESSECPLSRLS